MYSRNIAAQNIGNNLKMNPQMRYGGNEKHSANIPVKSFSDSFAYERFNNIGNKNEKQEISMKNDNSEQKVTDNPNGNFDETAMNVVMNDSTAVQASNKTVDVKQETSSAQRLLLSFKPLLEKDFWMIILVVIFTMLSDNTSKDKITPLALLAVLLL